MAPTRVNSHGRGINRYPMNPPLTSAMRARVDAKMDNGFHCFDIYDNCWVIIPAHVAQHEAAHLMNTVDRQPKHIREELKNPHGDY